MYEKNDDLLQIEQCLMYIKSGELVNDNINQMETILARIFETNIHISIIKNPVNKFFGVSVYPSINTMKKITEQIVDLSLNTDRLVETWVAETDWYIEIDSMLMDPLELNASPSETLAMIIHEIGHVIYSNEIIQPLSKVIRTKIAKLNYITKKLLSSEKIQKLFYLTILEACNSKDFRLDDMGNEEIVAISFVNRYGYKTEMENVLEKVIGRFGNDFINRKPGDIENDIKIIINWVIVNIRELEFRKKSLRTALKVEIMTTPSYLAKRILQNIYVSFFGDSTDKYRELLSEQYTGESKDIVAEMESEQRLDTYYKNILNEAIGSIFDKRGKVKKVNQIDIDMLQADVSRIVTNDDKIYLLDRLYIQLDKVQAGLDQIELGNTAKVSQSKSTLLSMKKQLERLRAEILSTRIVDKSYGLFIKYPKGYEG